MQTTTLSPMSPLQRPSISRLPGCAFAALGAALLVGALATTATGTGSIAAPEPRILSASWGTDNAVGCPPAGIRVVGALQGKAPGANRWRRFPPLPKAEVDPLSGGPYIVDAWRLAPALYRGDPNRCTVGRAYLRVMWSNGLTAYPTGEEVGAAVAASYRAVYRLPDGRAVALAPLEVADLHDHASSFNADNMHDLCLPQLPRGAQLARVTIAGGLIQDPNGDPNDAQKFRAPRS